MANRLYKRRAELIIGRKGQTSRQTLIAGARIVFQISMNDTKQTNVAKISIYNLSQDVVGLIEQKDATVTLKIGYDDDKDLSTIFIGDVVQYNVDTSNGIDRITKLVAHDGYIALANRKVTLSFAQGSTTRQILAKIIADLDLTKKSYDLPNLTYKQGFSFIGSPREALTKVLNRIKYEWAIVNNALLIFEKDKTKQKVPAQLLTLKTGLEFQPTRTKQLDVKTQVNANKSFEGWEVRCLIIPSIQPKNIIKVETDNFNGLLIVKAVEFKGDSDGDDWISIIQATEA